MTLENIILSEERQTQKDKYWMIQLHEIPTVAKFMETESEVVITGGRGD